MVSYQSSASECHNSAAFREPHKPIDERTSAGLVHGKRGNAQSDKHARNSICPHLLDLDGLWYPRTHKGELSMSAVQLPERENILMSAFLAVSAKDPVVDSSELISEYGRHFSTAVEPLGTKSHVFERFSLIDTSVWMTVQANTSICSSRQRD